MSDSTTHNDDRAVALKSDGNPEGKGVNAFMLDWHRSKPQGVVAKPRRQLLAEFFTSMLVLSATFKFRPVVNAPHFLYWIGGEWSLSLIGPQEWSDERRAAFAGVCTLHQDMTWTIELNESLTADSPVAVALSRFYDAFANTLDTERTLEDILPFYVSELPYYQRLYASALGRSMQASITQSGHLRTSSKSWLTALPADNARLLERSR